MYLTMINTLRRRRSVPPELFYAYWRDTHVGVAARLPGIDTLWTHWVSWEGGRRWPRLAGVDGELAADQQFDGVPEPCFARLEDLQSFGAAMGPLMDDEANLFERTIGYQSLGENSETVVNRLDPAPNGRLPGPSYFLFLRQRPELSTADFRGGIRNVTRELATDDRIAKLRLHLLEPYENAEVFLDAATPAVSHAIAPADQHQAVLELGFGDDESEPRLLSGEVWRGTVSAQRELCVAIHPFAIDRTYTWKVGGRPTLAALRGAAVVDQIRALNAVNQVSAETLALFGGGPVADLQLT